MVIKSAFYSLYSNEQWCYKDIYSSVAIDAKKITKYATEKVQNGGIYCNLNEHIFFISSNVTQRKGETPSIRLNPDDLIIDDSFEQRSIDDYYNKNYIVDFIFSNNDGFINSLRDDMQPLGAYIREGKAVQKQSILLGDEKLLSNISNAKLTNIVCAVVDALLKGNSVLLYGQIQNKIDSLNIIFYSLRCIPPRLANSIIINTNMKNKGADSEQFIGYMTNCVNLDGVCSIDISNYENIKYEPISFYTVYLKYLIEVNGVLSYGEIDYVDKTDIIKHLNIMAINNIKIELTDKKNNANDSECERCKRLKDIILLMDHNEILSIVEDNRLTKERRDLLENWIRDVDSLKYIYICNATKQREDVSGEKFKMNESTKIITLEDLLEVEKFYRQYAPDEQAIKFVKDAFLQCIPKIDLSNENVFDLVYKLKIYLNVDISKMGFSFIDKTHYKYSVSDQIKENSHNNDGGGSKQFNNLNGYRTVKGFFQSSAFVSAISLLIPILIGAMLYSVPDRIWKYYAIILHLDTWYIMPIVLGIALILAFTFYLIPYFIMRKNTVHLNGFSNIDSTGVSCACMSVAALLPIVVFVVEAAFV